MEARMHEVFKGLVKSFEVYFFLLVLRVTSMLRIICKFEHLSEGIFTYIIA